MLGGGSSRQYLRHRKKKLSSFLYHLKEERILIIESISPKAYVENASAQWAIFNLI